MWTQRETNVQYAHGKNAHANNKASCCFCTHCCKSNSAIAFVSCMLRSMHNNTLKTGTMNRAYHDCLTGKGIGTPLCDYMRLYAGHELYCCPYFMHICCSQGPISNCIFHNNQEARIWALVILMCMPLVCAISPKATSILPKPLRLFGSKTICRRHTGKAAKSFQRYP